MVRPPRRPTRDGPSCPGQNDDASTDRRTVAILLAIVLVGGLLVSLAGGAMALGYLTLSQPSLSVTDVTTVDDERERVAWTTRNADRTSLQTYVKVDGGPWYAVERLEPTGNETSHAVTTDLHALRNRTYENETIPADDVEGYRVAVTAWRDGEVVSVDLLRVNRSQLAVNGSGLRVPDERTVTPPE